MCYKKYTKHIFLSISLLFSSIYCYSQVGISTISPDTNSDLTLGSIDKGLLPNRVDLRSFSDPYPLSAPITDGMVVYNETQNSLITKGIYVWQNNQWNKLIMSEKRQQDISLISFKQTDDNDQIIIPYGSDVELPSLGSTFTASRDGNIYIGAVIYVKMSVEGNLDHTSLSNTFFRIEITDLTNNDVTDFVAACTAISAPGTATAVNHNPSSAVALCAYKVYDDHDYQVKVYGQEGWNTGATITAGTYAWRTYKAYSVIKIDYISDSY